MHNKHHSSEEVLRAKIMRRVRGVYVLRRVFALAIPQLVLLAIGAGLTARFVWVSQVFANMPSIFDIGGAVRFFFSAFTHTELIVQCAVLLMAIGFAWLLARLVSEVRMLKPAVV